TKPNHICRYLVSDARRGVGGGDHITAADIDLILEGDGDSVIDPDDKGLAILRQKLFHAAVAPRGVDRDLIARPHGPRNDSSGEATKPTPRSNDILHGHGERMIDRAWGDVDGFEELHQTWPSIPGHARACVDDVVTMARRDRQAGDLRNAEPSSEVLKDLNQRIK